MSQLKVVNLTTIEKTNSSRGRGECIVYIYSMTTGKGKERSSELNISNKDENLFELEVEVKE